MDKAKQTLLLEYLISSVDTFAICTSIVQPNYFDPELRNTVEFIQKYYDDYHTVPDELQIEAETGIVLTKRQITRDKIDYCSTEIEAFCKRRAMERAIIEAPKWIQKGDYGTVEKMLKDAVTVSLNKDIGLKFFEDPLAVLNRLLNEDSSVTTGWPDLDIELGGGMRRKEMVLFTANSGGGKSITMANLAINLLAQGFNALYISLELSQDMISKRFCSMFTGIKQVNILQHATEVAHKLKADAPNYGELIIKRMPNGTTANQVRGLLKEIELTEGYVPDVIVMDYVDLMNPNEKLTYGGVFEKDKATSEQLREIGEDYNCYIITASQQNRQAVQAVNLDHSHIAGGLSKVNTTDVWISIILNDAMKSEGIMRFELMKTRSSDGVGKQVQMKWDGESLRILSDPNSPNNPTTPLKLNKRSDVLKDIIESSEDGDNLLKFFD